jgi:hypothetical protein
MARSRCRFACFIAADRWWHALLRCGADATSPELAIGSAYLSGSTGYGLVVPPRSPSRAGG